jgi:hypothetical protein
MIARHHSMFCVCVCVCVCGVYRERDMSRKSEREGMVCKIYGLQYNFLLGIHFNDWAYWCICAYSDLHVTAVPNGHKVLQSA